MARTADSAGARRPGAFPQDPDRPAAPDRRRRAVRAAPRPRDGARGRPVARRAGGRARARHRAGDAGADRARRRRAKGWCWSNTTTASAACWRSASRRRASSRATPTICRRRSPASPASRSPPSSPACRCSTSRRPRRVKLIEDAFALMGPARAVRPVHLWPRLADSARSLRAAVIRAIAARRSGATCRRRGCGPTAPIRNGAFAEPLIARLVPHASSRAAAQRR